MEGEDISVLSATQSAWARTRDENDELREKLAAAQVTIDGQAHQIAELNKQLAERDARIVELEQDRLSWVMLCDEQSAKLEGEVQEWVDRHGDINNQLMIAQSTIYEQAQQLAERDVRIAELTNQLAADQVAEAPPDNFASEMLRIITLTS